MTTTCLFSLSLFLSLSLFFSLSLSLPPSLSLPNIELECGCSMDVCSLRDKVSQEKCSSHFHRCLHFLSKISSSSSSSSSLSSISSSTSRNPAVNNFMTAHHLLPSIRKPVARNPLRHFHTFFLLNPSRSSFSSLATMVSSFVATQYHSVLNIWTKEEEFSQVNHTLYTLYASSIRLFIEAGMVRLHPFRQTFSPFRREFPPLDYAEVVGWTNVFRFFILEQNPGMYIELDTLFFRSFTPLWDLYDQGHSFSSRWASKEYATLSILALPPKSSIASIPFRSHSFHPEPFSNVCCEEKSCRSSLTLLPPEFFDPVSLSVEGVTGSSWCDLSKFEDLFSPSNTVWNVTCFTSSAFATHWHGQWDASHCTPTSPIRLLRDTFAETISTRFGYSINLCDEERKEGVAKIFAF